VAERKKKNSYVENAHCELTPEGETFLLFPFLPSTPKLLGYRKNEREKKVKKKKTLPIFISFVCVMELLPLTTKG
jgi:hypothetical protein